MDYGWFFCSVESVLTSIPQPYYECCGPIPSRQENLPEHFLQSGFCNDVNFGVSDMFAILPRDHATAYLDNNALDGSCFAQSYMWRQGGRMVSRSTAGRFKDAD